MYASVDIHRVNADVSDKGILSTDLFLPIIYVYVYIYIFYDMSSCD